MNYFAHGFRYVDDPYFLAGTAVPDWLNVVDRRLRIRAKRAAAYLEAGDPLLRRVAAGIVQHHRDDARFHDAAAFVQVTAAVSCKLRAHLPAEAGHRPGFVAHVLVEVLLDAVLADRAPGRLEDYYRAIDALEPLAVADYVAQMAGRPADSLARWIDRFSRERFLFDYSQDAKLSGRLNQVMARVGLPRLPLRFTRLLPEIKQMVFARRQALLHGIVENWS